MKPFALSANDRLLKAVSNGDVAAASLAISDGANVDCESGVECMTPLMLAAFRGESTCLALLIAHGADCTAWIDDSGGLSLQGLPCGIEVDALYFAAQSGSKKCIELLFDALEGDVPEFRLRACLSQCDAPMNEWLLSYAHGGWERDVLGKSSAAPSGAKTPFRL